MLSKEKEEVLRLYNIGLEAYKGQRWDDALESFRAGLKIDPDDGPTKVYIERCEYFKENPPGEDWDGVYTMTTK